MHWLLAAALALIALILLPGWTFYFDITPKLMVLLAAVGVAWTWPRASWRHPLWLLAPLGAISLAVSSAAGANPALSVWGTSWRSYGALTQVAILLLALCISTQAHRIRLILRVVVAGGALTAIYGIAQYFGFDPILPAAAYHIGEGIWTIVRPPSTLGYVSYFATWLVFVIFLSLANPGRWWRAITVLATIAMLLTGTRAAMLGALAGFAVWLLWRGWRIPRRALLAGGFAGVLAMVAAAVFLVSPAGLQLRSRTRWFAEDPWGGARLLLWRDSLRMSLARPVAGYGPEVFSAAFPHFESAELARAYPDFAHESPHNIFLDALVAQGVPGLLLLIAACVVGWYAAWRARERHPQVAGALAAALAAGVVAQQFTVFTIPTAAIFFATIGLAVGLAMEPRPLSRLGERGNGALSSSLTFTAPFAIPLLFVAAHYALADHALVVARHALNAGDLTATASGADLWHSRSLFSLAQKSPDIRQRLAALQQATAAARRATATAEDPFNAWYNLATILAAQNDTAGCEHALRAAIAARPNWFKPHWTLAQLLLLESRLDEARIEAARAADLDGGNHPEVAATLARLHK